MEETKQCQPEIQRKNSDNIERERGNATIKNYRLVKTIGKGHYSKVKLAQDKRSGQFLAVKIIKRHHVEWLSLPTFQKILNNEVKLLQHIQHPNIIDLVDWNCKGELVVNHSGRAVQIFFIVLELVESGDLFSYIKQKNESGGFNESYARYYFAQMLEAMDYLHNTAGVVHRDLKPENLLLSHDYKLKIADFGLSAHADGEQGTGIHYSSVGTRQYQAPEVLEQRSYRGDRVDIFSMGVILFTMVTGAMPYLTEASVTDPLYKLILRRCKEDYWDCWRTIRESNNKKPTEDEYDQIGPDTSFMEDIREAICNCTRSFFSSLLTFLLFLVNTLKFIFTLGKSTDLFQAREQELPLPRYSYSNEFKDLVFDMMAYNHKQRPTLEQIRNHPWMKMAQEEEHHKNSEHQEDDLRQQVIQEMTQLKRTFLVEQINSASGDISDDSQNGQVANQMPSTFRDFLNFHYNTATSFSSFISVVSLISWSKILNKCGCRRAQNATGPLEAQKLANGFDDQIDLQEREQCTNSNNNSNKYEESSSELLSHGSSPLTDSKGKLVEAQHQLLVDSIDNLKTKTAEQPQSSQSAAASASGYPYKRNLHRLNPLDVQANQSSSINNWLDDQIKKESHQKRRNRVGSEGREN